MKILVCGGRDFQDAKKIHSELDNLSELHSIQSIVHGGCQGVDVIAGQWAKSRNLTEHVIKANWKMYGKSAGPRRNAAMLRLHPDINLVVAFPGGRGTANMTRLAQEGGFKVILIGEKTDV